MIWDLPEWTIVSAESRFVTDLTENEAEYNGLIFMLRIAGVSGSRPSYYMRQLQFGDPTDARVIYCKAPGPQLFTTSGAR